MILLETVYWVLAVIPDDWNETPRNSQVPPPPTAIPAIVFPVILIAPCPVVPVPANIPENIALAPEVLNTILFETDASPKILFVQFTAPLRMDIKPLTVDADVVVKEIFLIVLLETLVAVVVPTDR